MEYKDHTSPKDAMKELTMLLLYLSRFAEGKFSTAEDFYAWKGYDFDMLNELDDQNMIYQGEHPSRRKTVYLTAEGMAYARQLLEKYGIDDWMNGKNSSNEK